MLLDSQHQSLVERGRSIKPIEKEVQFIGPVHTALQPHITSLLEPRTGSHATPHIPHVVSLEFILQLSPVIVFSLPDVKFEYPLHSPNLITVALSERPLLLVQDDLDVLSDRRFINRLQSEQGHCSPHRSLCNP